MDSLRRYTTAQLGREDRYVDPNKKDHERGIMSDARKDAFDSMLNLILTHKKEIVKVPACSTKESADEWVKKRPGFRVVKKNIGGDEDEEIVVYDRNGNPYIVNGYKIGSSDYGFRKAYYTANDTAEKRAGYSMKDWKNEVLFKQKVDPNNPWKNLSVRPSKLALELKEKGWNLPTKPKLQHSVYAVFSKLISPFVKAFFETERFTALAGGQAHNMGPNSSKFLQKVISPITIYRYLYMKIVLRNYFFQQIAEGKVSADYAAFQRYLKQYKNRFFTWFCDNFLSADKTDFKESRIDADIVKRNLVDGQLNVDGSDVNDGLVFIMGLDNVNDGNPAYVDGNHQPRTFAQILFNDAIAAQFIADLKNKSDRARYSLAKKLLTRFKDRAQKGAKRFFNDKMKVQFFLNDSAAQAWQRGAEYGCFTLTSEEAIAEHEAKGGKRSPVKPTQNVKEDVKDLKSIPEEEDNLEAEEEEEEGEMIDAKKLKPGEDEDDA